MKELEKDAKYIQSNETRYENNYNGLQQVKEKTQNAKNNKKNKKNKKSTKQQQNES